MFINPKAYNSELTLEMEYERIFSKSFFVENEFAFKNHNDYLSYQLCGRPFTTRNISSSPLTLDNTCLHRLNLIDSLGKGNKPFRCAYHGWKYGAEGALSNAPLSSECKNKKLKTYHTINDNGLIFSSINGKYEQNTILSKINFQLSEPFYCEKLTHEANWKLLVENVIEGYHLSFVHPSSFVPMGIDSNSKISVDYDNRGSSLAIVYGRHEKSKLSTLIPTSNNDYIHAYIFPNLFISITGGLIGFISSFKPNDFASTTLEWQLFEMPILVTQKKSIRDYIKNQAILFTKQVLQEDLEILNNCQIGMKFTKNRYQLQENENRVKNFHKTYLEFMQ